MHKGKGVLVDSPALLPLKLCIFFRLFLSFFRLFLSFFRFFYLFCLSLSFFYPFLIPFPPYSALLNLPCLLLSSYIPLLLFFPTFPPLMFCLIPLFNISLSYPLILFHSFYILKPCYNLYSFSLSSLYSPLYFIYSLPLFLLSLLYLPAL